MVNVTGNLFKYKTTVAMFNAHTFKAKLMGSGFTFNRATMTKWADVSASELSTLNGYTVGGVSLSGVAIAQDNVNHKATVKWTNPSWTASGGSIGPAAGLMVIDDTDTDKMIVMYIPFVDASGNRSEQTQADGGVFTIAGVEYDQVDTIVAD